MSDKKKRAIDWLSTIGIVGSILQWLIKLWHTWTGKTDVTDVPPGSSNDGDVIQTETEVEHIHTEIEENTSGGQVTPDGGIDFGDDDE